MENVPEKPLLDPEGNPWDQSAPVPKRKKQVPEWAYEYEAKPKEKDQKAPGISDRTKRRLKRWRKTRAWVDNNCLFSIGRKKPGS